MSSLERSGQDTEREASPRGEPSSPIDQWVNQMIDKVEHLARGDSTTGPKAFSWSRTTGERGVEYTIFLPSNLETFADSRIALLYVYIGHILKAKFEVAKETPGQFKIEENPWLKSFLDGALDAVRFKKCPHFISGTSEYWKGFIHMVAMRLPMDKIPKRWFRASTVSIQSISQRLGNPKIPSALSSLYALMRELPYYEKDDNMVKWVKDLRSQVFPKKIDIKRIGVFTEPERDIILSEITAVNRQIDELMEDFTLDKILSRGELPDVSKTAASEAKKSYVAKYAGFIAQRMDSLYKDDHGRVIKSRKKMKINEILKDLDPSLVFRLWGPWKVLGLKPPLVETREGDKYPERIYLSAIRKDERLDPAVTSFFERLWV